MFFFSKVRSVRKTVDYAPDLRVNSSTAGTELIFVDLRHRLVSTSLILLLVMCSVICCST
jgi:hypothetical protein